MTQNCPLCKRDVPERRISEHHLRTRKVDPNLTVDICAMCHSTIHRFFSNRELAAEGSSLASVEGLLANPEYAKAVQWIAKQDPARKTKVYRTRRREAQRRR